MGLKVQVNPGAYLITAAMLLLVPPRWWMGAVLAASAHELGHLLAVWFLGGHVTTFYIGVLGAKIETYPLSRGREAASALVGPLVSLMISNLIGEKYAEAALCALMQGSFNLLPIYPLDGGRILRCFVSDAISRAMEVSVLILLFGIGIWICFTYDMGWLPLIPAGTAAVQLITRKIPCKETKIAVQ